MLCIGFNVRIHRNMHHCNIKSTTNKITLRVQSLADTSAHISCHPLVFSVYFFPSAHPLCTGFTTHIEWETEHIRSFELKHTHAFIHLCFMIIITCLQFPHYACMNTSCDFRTSLFMSNFILHMVKSLFIIFDFYSKIYSIQRKIEIVLFHLSP